MSFLGLFIIFEKYPGSLVRKIFGAELTSISGPLQSHEARSAEGSACDGTIAFMLDED